VSSHVRLNEGVFIGSHAVAAGLVRPEDLRRRHRRVVQGVYATRGLPFDHDTRCLGTALVLPAGYAIGGLSAVGWYAAPLLGPVDPVVAVGPGGATWRGPREVRVHRSDVTDDDVLVDRRGVPVTGPWRTAWDVAAMESLPNAVAALDRLAHEGVLDLGEFAAWVQDRRGKWRVTQVRRAVELADARAESPEESRVRVALVRAGLLPEVQVEVFDDQRALIARVDLAFPELKIAIEYDGAHHFTDQQVPRDNVRLARLRAAGWVVLRLANADLYDMDDVVRRVQALVGQRTA